MEIDLFFNYPTALDSLWGNGAKRTLKTDFFEGIRKGQATDVTDLEVCIALTALIRGELTAYGTSGGVELSNDELRIAISALRAVLQRVGVAAFSLPFRDFTSFQTYWITNGCSNSYQARRTLLATYFDPLQVELDQLDDESLRAALTKSVSEESKLGWSEVERQVVAMRKHFSTATTAEDYRNIGKDAVHLLEALGRQVYDPVLHRREGEPVFGKGETKNRIERFIEDGYKGAENAELRKLVRSTIEYAQKIKHGSIASRREAVISGNAVILLTEILHQLSLPDEAPLNKQDLPNDS